MSNSISEYSISSEYSDEYVNLYPIPDRQNPYDPIEESTLWSDYEAQFSDEPNWSEYEVQPSDSDVSDSDGHDFLIEVSDDDVDYENRMDTQNPLNHDKRQPPQH